MVLRQAGPATLPQNRECGAGHADRRCQNPRLARRALAGGTDSLAAPLALFVQLAMLLLMLAWAVPLPFLRNRLRALQAVLVGFLGDAYALREVR